MSFSELEKARSKGAAKDRAVTDKKKLGCKRNNAAMEYPLFKKAMNSKKRVRRASVMTRGGYVLLVGIGSQVGRGGRGFMRCCEEGMG
jgi:hypothetical protein